MSIASNKSNPIRPVGSDVTLTCTVELSPAIDVNDSVIVDVQLIDPAKSLLTTTTPSISDFTYTSSAVVSTFGRSHSGIYTCIATISTTSLFLMDGIGSEVTHRVTVGK